MLIAAILFLLLTNIGNVIYFNNSVIRGYYDGMGGVSLTL